MTVHIINDIFADSTTASPCLYKGFSGHSCQHICSIYKQHGLLIQDCRDGLKSKNTDNTSHVEVVGTCCNIYQYNIKSIVSVCEGAMKKVHVVSLYNEQEKGSRFEQ